MIHKDNRRTIYDWTPKGIYKSNKVVFVHEEISIGDHLHRKKDEHFFLASGKFLELQLGEGTLYNLDAPYVVNVPRNTYHRFICSKGSILIGVATEEFDETDEIKQLL